MNIGSVFGRARSWIGGQFGSLTRGQRWTSAIAMLVAVAMISIGMPSNVRVIAAPPIVVPQPPTVVPPPIAPPVPFVRPVVSFGPDVIVKPAPPEKPEPPFTPPPPTVHPCLTDETIGIPVFATLAEQLAPIQASYQEATGQPLGVDLVSVMLTLGQCTDALPNVPALITIAAALNEVYDMLEAAGVPPVQLPDDPPVVSLPDIPEPLQPVLGALAPIALPACAGVQFFGVTIGVNGVFGLMPLADGLLPFPTAEIMPYLWPARAVCALLVAYAPEPEPASAAAPTKLGR